MRYILMMAMLVSILFAQQQKQIILGSFSIESNALFYSIDVQKHVDKDAELKKLIDKYSLKVEYKKVGAYNVVSICPFDNYPSLFVTIAEVKKHYPEAYAINFPAFASELANKKMSAKPMPQEPEEELVENSIESQEEAVEEETVLQEEIPQKQEEEIKYEPNIDNPIPLPSQEAQSEGTFVMFDLILLIALLLVIIGFVIYKIKMKKQEEEKEEER